MPPLKISRDQGSVRVAVYFTTTAAEQRNLELMHFTRILSRTRFAYSMPENIGPIESSIREKLSSQLTPKSLEVINESHLHAGHMAMRDLPREQKLETHFSVKIVSEAFKQKTQMQRHRMVYGILDDEIKINGVHALSISSRTPEEQNKLDNK